MTLCFALLHPPPKTEPRTRRYEPFRRCIVTRVWFVKFVKVLRQVHDGADGYYSLAATGTLNAGFGKMFQLARLAINFDSPKESQLPRGSEGVTAYFHKHCHELSHTLIIPRRLYDIGKPNLNSPFLSRLLHAQTRPSWNTRLIISTVNRCPDAFFPSLSRSFLVSSTLHRASRP